MTDSKYKTEGTAPELLRLATEIVSAFVSKNSISAADLPGMIKTVHSTLTDLEQGGPAAGAQELNPAVPVKKSVTPEYIVCLEDGKKLKMLKRYLRSQYGLSPEEYRARWGLPADYPMVAPNYAAQRSKLAKQIGLGRSATAATPRARRKK
jgi:predicted transcriptional regulator